MTQPGHGPTRDEVLRNIAEELCGLHVEAGKPSLRDISRMTDNAISHTTVAKVLRCDKLPRWGQLELVVEALDGDVDHFRRLWRQAHDATDAVAAIQSLGMGFQRVVGRTVELERLRSCVDGLNVGRGLAVLVKGEPGIRHREVDAGPCYSGARSSRRSQRVLGQLRPAQRGVLPVATD